MRRYHIEVLGICESRWNGSGFSKLISTESIFNTNIVTQTTTTSTLSFRVAIMMSSRALKAVMQWGPISSSIGIITARFNSKGRKEGHNHTRLHYAMHLQIMQMKRRMMNSTDHCNQHWTRLQLATTKF
ncbi:unnamed protein product [Heterobilharzia americana]|nr:unnamed protein product [Heterobilharzia americana]